MSLVPSTAARLAFVRYLLRSGTSQASRAEPLSALGLLALHDAVELFCILATEHVGAEVGEKTPFIQYWDALEKAPRPVDLGYRQAMRRLNRARVSFKHHGTMPSRMDLQGFVTTTKEFLFENTSKVFDVDFDTLSMVDLVTFDTVRALLRQGEEVLANGELHTALVRCSAGYSELRRSYRAARWGRLASPLDLPRPSLGASGESEFASYVVDFALDVESAFEQVDDTLEALAIGVDVERLLNYQRAWPRVRRVGNEYEDNEALRHLRRTVTSAFVRESLDFVVECALVLQQRLADPYASDLR